MRRFLFTFVLLMTSFSFVAAQNNITEFLGIQLDGTKSEMIKKIEEKGFKYDQENGRLTGIYEKEEVQLEVETNDSGKVWRIVLFDKNFRNEIDIRDRFNSLFKQFSKNYMHLSGSNIPKKESIIEGIKTDKYRADFGQVFKEVDAKQVAAIIMERYSKDKLKELVFTEKFSVAKQFVNESVSILSDLAKQRLIWFKIEDNSGQYRIVMFFQNEKNKPQNGGNL